MPHHLSLGGEVPRLTVDIGLFHRVNALLRADLYAFAGRWGGGGYMSDGEYIVPNPLDYDAREGALRLSLQTGRWVDFTTGHRGSDPISYFAYTSAMSQIESLYLLAADLGVD